MSNTSLKRFNAPPPTPLITSNRDGWVILNTIDMLNKMDRASLVEMCDGLKCKKSYKGASHKPVLKVNIFTALFGRHPTRKEHEKLCPFGSGDESKSLYKNYWYSIVEYEIPKRPNYGVPYSIE